MSDVLWIISIDVVMEHPKKVRFTAPPTISGMVGLG